MQKEQGVPKWAVPPPLRAILASWEAITSKGRCLKLTLDILELQMNKKKGLR